MLALYIEQQIQNVDKLHIINFLGGHIVIRAIHLGHNSQGVCGWANEG